MICTKIGGVGQKCKSGNKINRMITFYNNSEIMDDLAIDYRIKSEDSCLRKYDKFYPDMRVEKTFNDVLGFRMLCDNYDEMLNQDNRKDKNC